MRSMRFALLSVLAVSCATTPPVKEQTKPAEPALKPLPKLTSPGVRLPAGARPLGYQLELTVLPGQERFSGRITAKIEIATAMEVLWLNATELKLEPTTLLTEHGQRTAEPVIVDGHFVALVPRCEVKQTTCLIPAGTQDVTIAFDGALSKKDTDGLFQSKEGDEWYAYTSFEPIDARRAFPHFDEPQFKVPWEISLIVKAEHVALANTPQVSEEKLDNGLKRVRFAKSLPLPSYLVAVAAGAFEFVDGGLHGEKKTPVRIVVPKGKKAEAAWAAESTGIILERLEAWFGRPY
ncbi:MAG: M1 family peptidase, partial [Archangium sp.]|nr:M1 family peptidase [Archangium sp.]